MIFNKFDILNALVGLLLAAVIILMLNGCAQREPEKVVVTKYKYIEASCPRQKTYKMPPSMTLTITSNRDTVCIDEWKTCMPTASFMQLSKYIIDLKNTCNKYRNEIKIYNKKYKKTRAK